MGLDICKWEYEDENVKPSVILRGYYLWSAFYRTVPQGLIYLFLSEYLLETITGSVIPISTIPAI